MTKYKNNVWIFDGGGRGKTYKISLICPDNTGILIPILVPKTFKIAENCVFI